MATVAPHPAQAEQPVSIDVLGRFRLRAPATDESHASRRACELLQLLSLQPERSLPHDQVLEALWPNLGPEAGSANLRKAAHHARHFVGDTDAVVLRAGRVILLPGRLLECDAVAFERAADAALATGDAAACDAAAKLYGGDLLPDAVYEPWTEAPRRRLRAKYLALLRAARSFEKLLQEEPTDEGACAAVMRAELAAGRRTSAIRWYGRLRDHLQQAVGLKPGAEVEALYRQCVEGLAARDPVLVGRAVEIVRVLKLLRADADGPRGVLLRGSAGIGKTAFCRRLAREAAGLGWCVRSVQATDWTRPYGLTADLVEPLMRDAGESVRSALGSHASAVLDAMRGADGTSQSLPLPIGRHQVVGAVRRLLVATAPGRPVLLIVDDAHAADEGSAELLAQLAASGAPLTVLLACRPVMSPVLDEYVKRMVRAQTLEIVELGPLSRDEAALLARRAGGAALAVEAALEVARLADGNPFAVLELAHAPRAAGWPLARGVSDAIVQRLCEADESTLECLRRLALCGEDFDVHTAIALCGATPDQAASRLDAALRAEVLIVEAARYRFRHALVRQALVDAIPPHRRAALHRELAGSLEHAAAAPGAIGQQWLCAGEVDRAIPWSLAAASQAFRLGAYEDVLRHVEPLLRERPEHPEALSLRAEAMDALARPGTLAAYDAAAAVAQPSHAHELRAKRALAQVKMSDPPGALEYLKDVHPTTVAGRLAEALAYSGAAALGFGDPAEGTRRAAEVRRLALQTGDEGTLVIASWAQAAAAHARGDLHGSVWNDLQETSRLPQLAVRVFDGHLCITQRFLYGSRPYPEVIAFADALATEAKRLGAERGHAFAVTLRGEARLLNGQLDAAEKDLIAGGRMHRAIGGATGEALSLQRLAELAMYRGHPDAARALLDEALDVARQSGVGFHLLDRIYGTRIAVARNEHAALSVLEEAELSVRGPLETCPGCRITFAIPATVAAAKAHQTELAASHLKSSEFLANVVMKLPAWHAALHEAKAHVAWAAGDDETAHERFAQAAQGFRSAGHPLDEARCLALAAGQA